MNLLGVINDRSYGVVSYKLLEQLKCKFWPLFQTQTGLDYNYNLIEECQNKPYTKSHSIRIWHQFDLANHVGSPRIGFPIFELDQFKPNELEHLRAQDELFVCSKWASEVLSKYNLPSKVVPLGIDPSVFKPAQDNDICRFICIGKWEIRKGHDFLLKCFEKAFTKTDQVELYLSCHNPFLDQSETDQWESIYQKSNLKEKIRFVPWLRTQSDLARVIVEMSCGVFLSRAEGWNLEALEVMSMGKPIIVTDYSGHTEFCNESNSLLVKGGENELAVDGKWFFGQGNWMKLGTDQLDQTVEHMRYIYKNRPKNPNGILTGQKYTWENSANIIRSYCE